MKEASGSSVLATTLVLMILAVTLKVLLIPSYTSTDFEVHRNWLAITYSLPFQFWYYEETSEWTLDYPPLFAWFEWFLSHFAAKFDEKMVNVTSLNYKSEATLYFQRGSVITSDFVLLYAAYKCGKMIATNTARNSKSYISEREVSTIFFSLIAFSFGLLIVDHIHFQYNGFLFGIFFLSVGNIMESNMLWGAFWFTVLLNFKHIFLYIAPVYGVYLLRCYCMDRDKSGLSAIKSLSFYKLFALGAIVITIFGVTYGPFMFDIAQVLSRLFPFKRGLTHAYWAPNFWALYNFLDKVLTLALPKFGYVVPENTGSSTSGLVQNIEHSVLPSIPPIATFVLTIISILPCLFKMLVYPCKTDANSFNKFLKSIVVCALSSFMFGWHVHEKAILMALLPLTLLAVCGNATDAKVFLILQACGNYSLFPLLFTPIETVTKYSLFALYLIFSFFTIGYIHNYQFGIKGFSLPLLNSLESLYVYGIFLVEILCNLITVVPKIKHLVYLPLLLTSIYCAIGVMYSWILIYWDHISVTNPNMPVKKFQKVHSKKLN